MATDFDWNRHKPQTDFPDAFKFVTPGDTITGKIVEITTTTFGGRSEEVPELHLETEAGERSITATQVMLRTALWEKWPKVGDTLTVTYTGDSASTKAGRSPTKQFTVEVVSGNGAPEAGGEPEGDDDPLDIV